MGGYDRVKIESHREFLAALRTEKPDIRLQALCDRLLAERRVKADTSLVWPPVRDQTDVRRLATRRDPINASIQPIVSYVLNPDTALPAAGIGAN
jgi:hypothetical protein